MKDGGYLMIDHRASPGIDAATALKIGLDPRMVAEGTLFEAATLTCSHCKCAVMKNPLRQRERNTCSKCGYHYICDFCAAAAAQPDYDHRPFEKIAEEAIRQQASSVVVSPPPAALIIP